MKSLSILIAVILLSSCAGMNSSGSSGGYGNEFKGPGSPTDYIAMDSERVAVSHS